MKRLRKPDKRALVLLLSIIALTSSPPQSHAYSFKAQQARVAILQLKLDQAASLLKGSDDDPDIAIERTRLALYQGDCDRALAIIQRPDLENHTDAAELFAVASGCARATAATQLHHDANRGVTVRFQDDQDHALFPLLAETAARVRDTLEKDLGTRLPSPIFIDLVRDQLSLSAHSGLPEEAAQTTGTVAVAKWGRVLMLSPRATTNGYPWLDTLAHEMTHLALSQATLDRAPLWLQEGVAKREETRWRETNPFDHRPPADTVAAIGISRGLDLPLTGLGPSIAMLPSAEQAAVVFAEVASFIDFWARHSKPDALPKLLTEIRDGAADANVSTALVKLSGVDLNTWESRWRNYLRSQPQTLTPGLFPGSRRKNSQEFARRQRLGVLLLERAHYFAADIQLTQAKQLRPDDARVRCLHTETLLMRGEIFTAGIAVESHHDIRRPTARWWSLHDFLHGDTPLARWRALALDPLQPAVACHELPEGEMPSLSADRALCEAALAFSR